MTKCKGKQLSRPYPSLWETADVMKPSAPDPMGEATRTSDIINGLALLPGVQYVVLLNTTGQPLGYAGQVSLSPQLLAGELIQGNPEAFPNDGVLRRSSVTTTMGKVNTVRFGNHTLAALCTNLEAHQALGPDLYRAALRLTKLFYPTQPSLEALRKATTITERATQIVQDLLGTSASQEVQNIAARFSPDQHLDQFISQCELLLSPIIGPTKAKELMSEVSNL